MIIGIEGKPGSGKSSIAKSITNIDKSFIHLEESDVLLKLVDMAVYLKNENLNDDEIIDKINNAKIEYEVDNNKLNFIVGDYESGMSNLEKKLFVYNNPYIREGISNNIYKALNEIINLLVKDYNLVITGRELKTIISNINYHFYLNVTDEKRKERLINRDLEDEKIKLREIEENKLFNYQDDFITIEVKNKEAKEVALEILEKSLN